jgi:hypothetical protein
VGDFIVRILVCSVAALALSGCSWLGLGSGNARPDNQGAGHYNNPALEDCCFNNNKLSRWNIEGGVGTEFIIGGDAVTGSATHASPLFPATDVNDVSMRDAYDVGVRSEAALSYASEANRKFTGQVSYTRAEGREVNWGTQDSNVLLGTLSEYEAYGIEGGVRQYFEPKPVPLIRSVRPYVEGKVGAAYVKAIRLDDINETMLPDPRTPNTLAFYEDSWVPTAAMMAGIETPLFDRMTVAVETGVRFAGTPKTDNSDVGTVTEFNNRYAGSNNDGHRYTVPLTIRGRYRF